MTELARRDIFQAIADPTRRKIIDLLATGPKNINQLTRELEITQPAVSQQVKLLKECEVIRIETIGRERFCALHTEKLIPAFLWLEQYHKQWAARIDTFETYVNQLSEKLKTKKDDDK